MYCRSQLQGSVLDLALGDSRLDSQQMIDEDQYMSWICVRSKLPFSESLLKVIID
jgi:hypothetical protein